MPEWFVYTNVTYYPYAEIIEADTPEQAAAIMGEFTEGVVVLPVDAIAHIAQAGDYDVLADLRREGLDH